VRKKGRMVQLRAHNGLRARSRTPRKSSLVMLVRPPPSTGNLHSNDIETLAIVPRRKPPSRLVARPSTMRGNIARPVPRAGPKAPVAMKRHSNAVRTAIFRAPPFFYTALLDAGLESTESSASSLAFDGVHPRPNRRPSDLTFFPNRAEIRSLVPRLSFLGRSRPVPSCIRSQWRSKSRFGGPRILPLWSARPITVIRRRCFRVRRAPRAPRCF